MPSSIRAQEQAAPRPAGLVAVDGRSYPLEAVRIEARAEGGLASTTLTQSYTNPYDEPLEVFYTLPLPADGAVLGYAIHMGERVIRGEVMKREEAAKAYEDALFDGRTAGLLEQERDDTFTQRLGSLPAHQNARIEIQVLHPVAFVPKVNGGPARWEYRFPTVTGVRYEGAPGRVTDSERLDVDRNADGAIPTRVEVELTLADGAPDAIAAASNTHDIVTTGAENATRVSLRSGARLDRDLVVRWNASVAEGVRLVEGPGLPGDDGRYGLFTLVPPAVPMRAFTRDLTLILDASGSMSGAPLAWAKRVIEELLASLEPEDRFELLAFSNDVRSFTRGPAPGHATNIEQALRWLNRIQADGGTEMANAMIEALKPLRPDSQRQVVLLTDGQIGFEAEITGRILRQLPEGARVHALGVGSAPNRTLLQGVARAGRGVEVIVSAESELVEAAGRLRRAVAHPLLTDITVTGSAVRAAAPARPRDVMAGQPLVLTMELTPEGGMVEVAAQQAGVADRWVWRMTVPATRAQVSPIAIGALFGRETIADLELPAGGRDRASDTEIEAAALRHRIASRLTSLVAFAEAPSVDPRQPRRRERLAVEMPQGVSIEGTGLVGNARPQMARTLTMGPALLHSRNLLQRPTMLGGGDVEEAAAYGDIVTFHRRGGDQFMVEPKVLRYQGRLLVLEFEVPVDGMEIPAATLRGLTDGGEGIEFDLVLDQGSGAGPFRKGTIVRLAVRVTFEQASSRSWMTLIVHERFGKQPAMVMVRFQLPTREHA